MPSGVSCPCGAGVAHSLGKGEATSSNLVKGKIIINSANVSSKAAPKTNQSYILKFNKGRCPKSVSRV